MLPTTLLRERVEFEVFPFVFLRDKYFTGVGYLPDGVLERSGRICVYRKVMILSYEVVNLVL
jgi:hypothetical protein